MMNYTTLLNADSMYNTPAVLVHLHDRPGHGLPLSMRWAALKT